MLTNLLLISALTLTPPTDVIGAQEYTKMVMSDYVVCYTFYYRVSYTFKLFVPAEEEGQQQQDPLAADISRWAQLVAVLGQRAKLDDLGLENMVRGEEDKQGKEFTIGEWDKYLEKYGEFCDNLNANPESRMRYWLEHYYKSKEPVIGTETPPLKSEKPPVKKPVPWPLMDH